jgi:hypothetical protein
MFNLSVLHVWFRTWINNPVWWFHPNVLNQTRSTDKLNKLEDSIQKFAIGQEEQTSWTYRVISSKSASFLVQNFWMESPCMFNLSVLHVWFKTFGCNHPLCSTCQFFMSGSNLCGSIQVLNQIWSTDKLNIQEDSFWKFSTREVEHTRWFHPSFEPDMKNQYFMSGLKLLDGITLYVQIVCSSCLVQNFWIESPCMFNLFVLHVWFKTFRWNLRVIPSKSFKPDMKYWQLEHTGWFHPKVLNQTWSTDKLNIQGGSIQVLNQTWSTDKLLYVQFVSTSCLVQNVRIESPCMFKLVSTSCVVQNVWMESPYSIQKCWTRH